MTIPLEITYRNVGPSDAIEEAVHKRAASLEKVGRDIIGCDVAIEAPHRHKNKGNHFRVRVEVSTPGGSVASSRSPDQHGAHEDLYVAIRDAFEAVKRQLRDKERRRRGRVKTHRVPVHGRIVHLDPIDRYGFVAAADGREIYFDARSLLRASFDELSLGDEVRFSEEQGEKGPQASSIAPVGKTGHEKPNRGRLGSRL